MWADDIWYQTLRIGSSEREESKSNWLWVSREAVVSNSDVEKFGIPHFKKCPIQCSYPRIY